MRRVIVQVNFIVVSLLILFCSRQCKLNLLFPLPYSLMVSSKEKPATMLCGDSLTTQAGRGIFFVVRNLEGRNYLNTHAFLLVAGIFLVGCGSSQQFVAIPSTIDRTAVPHETIRMTAEDFHFTPEEIHVKQGTLVKLQITADGTHGISIGAFGIDERLEDGDTTEIEFYAQEKGEFGFHCSHFCGIGHLGMTGKLVVE
jgi:plastocyanin